MLLLAFALRAPTCCKCFSRGLRGLLDSFGLTRKRVFALIGREHLRGPGRL